MFQFALRVATPAVLLFLVSACAGPRVASTGSSAEPAGSTGVAGTTTSSIAGASADLERRFWARHQESAARFVQADVDFMAGMISHHAQALVMSALAPTNGAGSAVATLCSRIINAQQDEIATMQKWLRDRGQVVPEIHIDGLILMVHGAGEHHHHMPGMLSQAQLEELAAARGDEFDRLFLTYMIQHHKGALTMVDDLFAADGAAQDDATYKLAADIHADQVTEIARMELMLSRMIGGSR